MNIDDGALYWACDFLELLTMATIYPAYLCEVREYHILAFKAEVVI